MSFEPFSIGRFRCVHELSRGSTATVYIARFQGVEGFQKVVALKRVHDSVARDAEFVRRFVADARLAAALSHAGIVNVLECAIEGGAYCLAAEFVDGISLSQLFASLASRGRRLPPQTAAVLVMAIADVLDFAHRFTDFSSGRAGVVHGGLRPSKILLPRERGVKVLDFGVAEAFAYARRSLASPDWRAHAYMAPEVLEAAPLTPAADLFSLGALLYELVTGEPLFLRADAEATMLAASEARVPEHRDLPEPLWALVCEAVAADPAARVASASDLHDTLAGWLAEQRLAPPAAWAMGELGALYSDWTIPLPAESPDEEDPAARELKARRRLATVALAKRPEGLLPRLQAPPASRDFWDPLHALQDALDSGSESPLSGNTVAEGAFAAVPAAGAGPRVKRVPGGSAEPVRRRGQLDASDDWGEVATITEDFSVLSAPEPEGPDVEDPLDAGPLSGSRPQRTRPDPGQVDDRSVASGFSQGHITGAGEQATASPALQRRLEELAAGLEQLLAKRPEDVTVRTHLGGVYRQQGRFVDAERLLGQLLEDQPDYAPAWHQLGLLKQQLGRPEEAREILEHALTLDPFIVEARLTLAAVHLSIGAVDDAIAALTAVVAINWRSGGAHRLLARCFLRAGDPAAALEHCEYAASFGEQVESLRREILAQL